MSFGMLVILILVCLQFFKTSESMLKRSSSNADAFQNAKILMDLLSRDIQSLYYQDAVAPFWHKPVTNDTTDPQYNNEALAFISKTSASSSSATGLCEVKYTLWYDTASQLTDSAGWVMRSVTDASNTLCNYSSNFLVGYRHNPSLVSQTEAFTATDYSSAPYVKLIPYVTSLTFVCLDQNKVTITASDTSVTELPYSIEIIITLLDRNSWNKWVSLGGTPSNMNTTSEPAAAASYRINSQKTFTKTIMIGTVNGERTY